MYNLVGGACSRLIPALGGSSAVGTRGAPGALCPGRIGEVRRSPVSIGSGPAAMRAGEAPVYGSVSRGSEEKLAGDAGMPACP